MRNKRMFSLETTAKLVLLGVLIVKAISDAKKKKEAETEDIGYAVEVEQKQLPSAETH